MEEGLVLLTRRSLLFRDKEVDCFKTKKEIGQMKGIQQLTGVRDIKSIHSVGASCVPKAQRSAYIEMYMHIRAKNRLEKEIFILDKRKETAQRLLDSLNKRIGKLQAEVQEEHHKTCRSNPAKPLKKMSVQY